MIRSSLWGHVAVRAIICWRPSDDCRNWGSSWCKRTAGGDITYHGPGQLVAYPILRLADYQLNVGRYIRLLEQIVIDTLAVFGIHAVTDPPHTGVWTPIPGSSLQKICAIGIRVRRNVTLHGLALNVTTNLDHFQHIVPCGLAQRSVTSIAALLGSGTPDMARVKAALAERFRHHLSERFHGTFRAAQSI